MNVRMHTLLGALILPLCTASLYAAPVASMSCTGSGNAKPITFNVSSYSLNVEQTLNLGSQSSGAGAGKIVFNPLEVHASIAQFREFFVPAAKGSVYSSCSLTATGANGASVELLMKLVAVKSVQIAAQNAATKNEEAAAYTDIQFQFGELDVETKGGVDDGGTDGGWNQIKNTPSIIVK